MKQIVDKLNKIAKKINENVELSDRDLIIDSLDSITKAYGGTPNDSTLIVDKLDDIYNNIGSGGGDLTSATFTENGTFKAEDFEAVGWNEVTVNVAGGLVPIKSIDNLNILSVNINEQYVLPLVLTSRNELPGFSNLLVTVDNDTFVLYPSISNNTVYYNPAQFSDYSAIFYYTSVAPAGYRWYLITADEAPTPHIVTIEILNPETAILFSDLNEVASVPVDKYNNTWEIQLNPATNITSLAQCSFDSETGLLTLDKRYAHIRGGIV